VGRNSVKAKTGRNVRADDRLLRFPSIRIVAWFEKTFKISNQVEVERKLGMMRNEAQFCLWIHALLG